MTSTANRPNLTLTAQIGASLPKAAAAYRLIHTSGSPVVPDVNQSPYSRTLLIHPPGLADGDYYLECYDEAGQVMPDPAGEPVIVSFWRRKPAPAQPGASSLAASAPAAAQAPVPVTTPTSATAPAPAAAPPDDWTANPDKWAHKLQVRQDHQMRDLGVAVFQQGIEQLKEIRDIYATMGQEQYNNQRLALDYGREVFNLQKELLEERRAELAQRSQAKEEADSPRAKMDYTQLGIGILSTIQAITTAVLTRGTENRSSESRSDASDRPQNKEKPSSANSAATKRVMLVPEEQAELAMGELLKFSSPFELQKLLSDPAEQKKFAERLGEITGATSPSVQLTRKPGGGVS